MTGYESFMSENGIPVFMKLVHLDLAIEDGELISKRYDCIVFGFTNLQLFDSVLMPLIR